MEDFAGQIIKLALKEDLSPLGDISSEFVWDRAERAKAQIIAKEPGVFSCSLIIRRIITAYQELYSLDFDFEIQLLYKDGEIFKAGNVLVEIEAPVYTLLACERTILNFLQRLTGIASQTRKLVNLITNSQTKLLDTRKTSPGMRVLEKQAFKDGGGTNHRLNLSDMVMLKENHLSQIKNIAEICLNLRAKYPETKIEIEMNEENLKRYDEILAANPEVLMLDNFGVQEAAELITRIRQQNPNILIELSGGINETNLAAYANTMPDYISTSLPMTKGRGLDLSMLLLQGT